MKTIKILHIILAFVSGILLIGYEGVDDSPGAQGIGLLTIIASITIAILMIVSKNSAK